MVQEAITRLEDILRDVPPALFEMDETELSRKPSENKWSKKEILGHLIDSATNNHQRFVRGQFEDTPEIAYDQNNWNTFNFYQEIEAKQIIEFWTSYNRQLLEIMKRIAPERLTNEIKVGENSLTLAFLVVDYVEHLDHHLKQIVNY